MATFCRITGKSRGLPKSNYFPLLPPISPADAKRFCRITGKAYGLKGHHYIPVLFGKSKSKSGGKCNGFKPHVVISACKYLMPCVEESTDLNELLKKKTRIKKGLFVYKVEERGCRLVVSSRLEEAVRDGEVQNLLLSSSEDTLLLQLEGSSLTLGLRELPTSVLQTDLFEGLGVDPQAKKKDKPPPVKQDKVKKAVAQNWSCVTEEKIKPPENKEFERWKWNEFDSFKGTPVTDDFPKPEVYEAIQVNLEVSSPGLVQQPGLGDKVASLPVAPVLAPFVPLENPLENSLSSSLCQMDSEQLERTAHVDQIFACSQDLPSVDHIREITSKLESGVEVVVSGNGKHVHCLKIEIEGSERLIVGQTLETSDGPIFVPGQTVLGPTHSEFVPGITLQSPEGPKLLPGVVVTVNNVKTFVAGRTTLTRNGISFVQGQTITTKEGAKFEPGQTVITDNGLKFIPGQVINKKFVTGQVIKTSEGVSFVPGQTIESDGGQTFIPGVNALSEDGKWKFVPGKNFVSGSTVKFVPGKISENFGEESFVAGQYVQKNGEFVFVPGVTVVSEEGLDFVPGTVVNTPNGDKFVEGQVLTNGSDLKFVPGVTKANGEVKNFCKALAVEDLHVRSTDIDERKVSEEVSDGVVGQIVQSAHGVEFFPGRPSVLPAGKVVPGKLIRGKEIKFVPGIISGGKFVPGQIVVTESGQQFIPGQVVETTEGAKFVPGQVVETRAGPKFVPGQTIQTEEGPKFVPGQVVETRVGPTFIPGQVIHTDCEGARFVPGQVVETVEGPRFVPGKVVESGEQVAFVPGQVVETSEGLRFIAPDLSEESGFTVQGFEVSPEELKLFQPTIESTNASEVREMAIDSKMLKQLSEAGMAIGRQVPTEIPVIDITNAPAISAACALAKKVYLDPVSSAKVSQIYSSVAKLSKLGELKGDSEAVRVLNNILKSTISCDSEEEIYEAISAKLKKEYEKSIVETVDAVHGFLCSENSPLKRLNKVNLVKEMLEEREEEQLGGGEEVLRRLELVLQEEGKPVTNALLHLVQASPGIVETVLETLRGALEEVQTEAQAVEVLHRSIVAAVRDASQMNVVDLLKDSEFTEMKKLILGAVSLAKALDMSDTAAALLDILSDPKSAKVLAGDRISLEILRRLTIMKQLAEKRPELLSSLKIMEKEPYKARADPGLRQLVRESGALMVIPEEELTSSASVPSSLLFSTNSLAVEELLIRTRHPNQTSKILLIIKSGLQAVIPREAAHSVLTGTVPYTVLDEKGIRHFQPKHVFTAIKLPEIATHWFSLYNCKIRELQADLA